MITTRIKTYMTLSKRSNHRLNNDRLTPLEVVMKYAQYDDTFIHFSDIPKLGINPSSSEFKTPLGIYCYPLKSAVRYYNVHSLKDFPFASDRKFMYIFTYTGENLLRTQGKHGYVNRDMSNYYAMANIKKYRYNKFRNGSNLAKLWGDTYLHNQNATNGSIVKWNKLFRLMGIDGVSDDLSEGFIHPNEKCQAVFFSIKHIKVLHVASLYKKSLTHIAISKIKNEKILIKYVEEDGLNIEFISNPSEPVQLAAVRSNGHALEYIKDPSEAVKIAAVQQNPFVIDLIKNPSEPIQLAAVSQNAVLFVGIDNPSEAVQIAAVNKDGFVIGYIKNPSEAVQLAAVKQSRHAISRIPKDKVFQSVLNYLKNKEIA